MRTLLALFASASMLSACGNDELIVQDPDAGVHVCTAEEAAAYATSAKGGLDPCDATCRRPGGYICAYGTGMDRCPADDVVNDCDCYAGSGDWACTLVGVRDGGVGSANRPDGAPPWSMCRNNADCFPGMRCIFDPDPRETLGRCSDHH